MRRWPLLLALAACGAEPVMSEIDAASVTDGAVTADARKPADGAPATPDAARPTLALDVTLATLPARRFGTATAQVTLVRSGGAGATMLELLSLPAGVTGSFAPNPATGDAATLTVQVGGTAALGRTTVTVRGRAGTLEAEDGFVLDVLPFRLTGTVLDQEGQPSSFATVSVEGGPSATADAAGTFTLDDVPRPYDLVAVSSDRRFIVRFDGLTRADPAIYLMGSATLPAAGTVAGTFAPLSGTTGALAFGASQRPRAAGSCFTPASASYSCGLLWRGPQTITGTVHILRATAAGGAVTAYTGYGKRTGVSLTRGQTTSGQSVGLATVGQGTIHGTLTGPAGASLGSAALVRFDDGGDALVTEGAGASINLVVPAAPASQIWLAGIGELADAGMTRTSSLRGPFAVDASGVTIALVAPPLPSAPASGATGVTADTVFSWTSSNIGVFVIQAVPQGSGPSYAVVTRATSATLPFGARTPFKNSPYDWTLDGYGPHASVDDAAAPGSDLIDERAFFDTPGPGRDRTHTDAPRTFNTAP